MRLSVIATFGFATALGQFTPDWHSLTQHETPRWYEDAKVNDGRYLQGRKLAREEARK